MDVTGVVTIIETGVTAAATLGLAVLLYVAGVKMWKRIRGAA